MQITGTRILDRLNSLYSPRPYTLYKNEYLSAWWSEINSIYSIQKHVREGFKTQNRLNSDIVQTTADPPLPTSDTLKWLFLLHILYDMNSLPLTVKLSSTLDSVNARCFVDHLTSWPIVSACLIDRLVALKSVV